MKRVLAIAPHADDEIIGLGGTLLKHIKQGDEVYICIVTRGCQPIFSESFMEKLRAETLNCHQKLGAVKTFFLEFPSVMLDGVPRYELNNAMAKVFQEVAPQVVYIPHFGDMQKDHALVSEAAMVCVRPKYDYKVESVYAYETLSETEWNIPSAENLFVPNVWVDITDYIEKKKDAMECYRSQLREFPNPRSLRAIEALSEYRGSTVCKKNAEAFMLIRQNDIVI